MRFVRAFLLTILILVFTVGLVICLWPQLVGLHLGYQAHVAVSDFFELADADEVAESEKLPVSLEYVEAPESTPVPTYQELYAAMQEYNENIYATGQSGLCDAWAYQQPSFNLTAYGVESNTIGVINIPAMNVELPIYLGATSENMAAGAVHLSQTSLPIGGPNTNCVIAAHRGWYGAPYFRYIDILKIGDEVRITNLWETLVYRVSEVKIIDPDDIDEILIQPGRELLTLVTCHPYASGGLYRYVVYCERVPS